MCRAVLLGAITLAAGCDQGRSDAREAALTPLEFVEVVTALREAERAVAPEDSAAALFDERKAAILAEHGTTESQLRAFLVVHRDDITLMARVWDAIAQRLKHVPAESDLDRRPPPPPVLPDTGEQRLH